MLKYAIFVFAILNAAQTKNTRPRLEDSLFSALDKGLTHSLAYHYLWPFSQIVRAAAALENDEGLELLQIQSDNERYEISLNVKRFNPEELKITVKNQYVIVEGKHRETIAHRPIMTNHFVQRFALPVGCKPEEVKAVLYEDGVLAISAPKHKLPPPPPEVIVPIEVVLPVKKTEVAVESSSEEIITTEKQIVEDKKENVDNMTKKETVEKVEPKPSSDSPLWQHLMDTTTHVGKIRKKELKTTTKTIKENEVTKVGEGNGLDYLLIDTEVDE